MKNRGFTLIELLIVISVFAIVGAIAGTILATSLRTSIKTNVITNVRQNGNFAMTQMTKLIRYARAITSPFPCVYPSPTPAPAESSITVISADGGEITFSCNGDSDNPPNTIASNGASLLDTNTVELTPNSCTFSCTQQSESDYPVIDISFSLSQNSSGNFTEQKASANPIPFSTSILMRNLNR